MNRIIQAAMEPAADIEINPQFRVDVTFKISPPYVDRLTVQVVGFNPFWPTDKRLVAEGTILLSDRDLLLEVLSGPPPEQVLKRFSDQRLTALGLKVAKAACGSYWHEDL